MIAQVREYRRVISGWWSWWLRELMQMLPDGLQSWLLSKREFIVTYADNEISIDMVSGLREQTLYQGSESQPLPMALNGWLANQSSAEKKLLLAPKYLLEKEVTMPLAAEENLREALAYQLDHLTPFSSNQVYFDYLVKSRDKKDAKLQLQLTVAPKSKVDPILKVLRDQGFNPHRLLPIWADEKTPEFNLLPVDDRAGRFNNVRLINTGLLITGLILLMALVAYPIWSKHRVVEQLEPMVNQLQKESASIVKMREKVKSAEASRSFLSDRRKEKYIVLELLNEMTFITPDDTWINQFDIKDNELHVYGHSPSSAAMLQRIEASDMFSNAQYRSPVTQNTKTNTERFHISALIMQGEAK